MSAPDPTPTEHQGAGETPAPEAPEAAAPAPEGGAEPALPVEPPMAADTFGLGDATGDAPAATSDGAGDEVEHDLDALVARSRERDEYLALAQRLQADFDNYRKRMARDVRAAEARGVARLAKELLPALDNLHRALAAAEPDTGHGATDQHLAEGIRLVQAELSAALARVGIEGFSPQGERFDPAEHEAMAQIPAEGAESGTVVEVYQQGYRLKESVLRPARVVVAA